MECPLLTRAYMSRFSIASRALALSVLSTSLAAFGCAAESLGQGSDDITGVDGVRQCTGDKEKVKTTDHLNVRRCAEGQAVGTACEKVETLPPGTEVAFKGQTAPDDTGKEAWVKIDVPSHGLVDVWAHAGYLECNKGGTSPDGKFFNFDVQVSPEAWGRIQAGEKDVPVSVNVAGKSYAGARMELRGATSRAYPKKSYDLKFGKCVDPAADKATCEEGKKPRIFGALFGIESDEKLDKVALNASWIDGTMIRNKAVYDLARETGGMAPYVGFAHLSLNGDHHGFYQAIEKVDDEFFERRGIDPNGNLYKATQHRKWSPDGDPFHSDDNGEAFRVSEGNGSREELTQFFRDMNSLSMDDIGGRVLNLNEYKSFQMIQTFALNKDTFSKNYYLYREPSGFWHIVFWDCDTTFGQDWMDGGRTNPDEDYLYGYPMGEPAKRYFDQKFTDYLRTYRHELTAGRLTKESMNARFDALLGGIQPELSSEVSGRGKNVDAEIGWLKEAMARHHDKVLGKIQGECNYRPCE